MKIDETLLIKHPKQGYSDEFGLDATFLSTGVVYAFPKAGGRLPEHAHSDKTHITVLIQGSVKVLRNNLEEMYKAPSLIDFDVNVLHSLVALEDNTLIVNVNKA